MFLSKIRKKNIQILITFTKHEKNKQNHSYLSQNSLDIGSHREYDLVCCIHNKSVSKKIFRANDVKCAFDAFVIQSIKERFIIKNGKNSREERKNNAPMWQQKKRRKMLLHDNNDNWNVDDDENIVTNFDQQPTFFSHSVRIFRRISGSRIYLAGIF